MYAENVRKVSAIALATVLATIVVVSIAPNSAQAGDDAPWVGALADYLGVSDEQALAISEREGQFADVATEIQTEYWDDYVGAEWFGDHGVITVTAGAVEGARKIADAAPVKVSVEGTEGLGADAANDLTLAVMAKLRGILQDGDQVVVDSATGDVTITTTTESPSDNEALRHATVGALGPDVNVTVKGGGKGAEFYYEGGRTTTAAGTSALGVSRPTATVSAAS